MIKSFDEFAGSETFLNHFLIYQNMDISKILNRRVTAKSLLRMMGSVIVLWLIKRKAMHGYAIIKEMKDMGFYHFTPSKAYPLLKFMHSKKLIKKTKKGRRYIYSITDKGRKMLNLAKKWFRKGKKVDFFREMIGC